MKDIDTFIHQLRNPLNAISVNAELGKLSLQNAQSVESAIRAFEKILAECQTCADTLEQLKDSTEPE